jgi:hypothetical protein
MTFMMLGVRDLYILSSPHMTFMSEVTLMVTLLSLIPLLLLLLLPLLLLLLVLNPRGATITLGGEVVGRGGGGGGTS